MRRRREGRWTEPHRGRWYVDEGAELRPRASSSDVTISINSLVLVAEVERTEAFQEKYAEWLHATWRVQHGGFQDTWTNHAPFFTLFEDARRQAGSDRDGIRAKGRV